MNKILQNVGIVSKMLLSITLLRDIKFLTCKYPPEPNRCFIIFHQQLRNLASMIHCLAAGNKCGAIFWNNTP